MNWKTVNYLTHRWLGITLGALTFVWFASGIAMMYYPWPAPTPSDELARLTPFAPTAAMIGFDSAFAIAHDTSLTGGRLSVWNGRLTYALRRGSTAGHPVLLIDARTGAVRSPITRDDAVAVARSVAPGTTAVRAVDRLDSGDHYLLSNEYRHGFPAYVVRFADKAQTAVYVSASAGYVVGIVTDRTRWTTWLGTVPHWLYFKWLYTRHIEWWLWASYVLPFIAMIAGLSGIIIGVHQLLPHWRRGEWRISAYHGASQWHHLAGIVFGAFVVTWSFSGLLEVLGPDASATMAQVRAVTGARSHPVIDEYAAALQSRKSLASVALPIAIDRTAFLGRPGYVVHHATGRRWVDGQTGAVRVEITADQAVAAARASMGEMPVRRVDRIARYDSYYYARFHREMPLPVFRVAFDDARRSVMYLDAVTGEPTGFVDSEVRRYRWLRDGLHSFDVQLLNEHRVAWQVVVLPLMIGGTVVAGTGLWLALRRVRRIARTQRASHP